MPHEIVLKMKITDMASSSKILSNSTLCVVEDGDGDRKKSTGYVDVFVQHETRCLPS